MMRKDSLIRRVSTAVMDKKAELEAFIVEYDIKLLKANEIIDMIESKNY